jgi:DNA-directed RNA polymerase subunit L
MLLSEAQRAVLKQILMENTLLKQNRRCSSILFCWYESTTKVGSSSTINIKMQSGVNLNEVVVVGYGKTSQALQELLNKLKLRF